MTNLDQDEKRVLQALRELEPATLEELAAKSGLSTTQVKEILERLAKRGLLDSLGSESSSDERNSGERY